MKKQPSHSKIDYGVVHSLDVLKTLFQYKVCSLDFEFGDKGMPIAYGVAYGSYAKGFRIGKYPGNDHTKHLSAAGYKEIAMRFEGLVNKNQYKIFFVFGESDYYGLCKLYEKIGHKDILPNVLVCNVQPVLARQNKNGGAVCQASLIDAAYLMDVSLLGYHRHNPRDDALLLFEMVKQATRMTDSQFQAYQRALSQLRYKNINKVKAAFRKEIVDHAEASLHVLQGCNDRFSAMKKDIRYMQKLVDEIKREYPELRKNRKQSLLEKLSRRKVKPAAPEMQKLVYEPKIVRQLFVDEVLFHYPLSIGAHTPAAITVRHNNKTHRYFLIETTNHSKARKELGLSGNVFPLVDLKGRYKTQNDRGKTIIFIVQRAQYDRATKICFEQIMKKIIPSGNYEICEV